MSTTTIENVEQAQLKAFDVALKAVDVMSPIIDVEDTGKDLTPEMKAGLAQAYAIKGFRVFLAYQYNRALKDTALRSFTLVDQAAGKARALTNKEILKRGKQAYEELERIRELKGRKPRK